ncbi:hypothetical protein DM15PD_06740 [Aristophania vespae]|nr:hypothetical protein DM15PD_06740 [Aristophania vespae]
MRFGESRYQMRAFIHAFWLLFFDNRSWLLKLRKMWRQYLAQLSIFKANLSFLALINTGVLL